MYIYVVNSDPKNTKFRKEFDDENEARNYASKKSMQHVDLTFSIIRKEPKFDDKEVPAIAIYKTGGAVFELN
ncbi:hypothetical protein SCM19_04225 [Legionella pneumophila serogroup 1]|nr:hypothetical protein [Legionella pneumophila]HAU0605528.1 hypothetical protein [Legionella pneumophila]HAU0959668.1 hypothetical protein [Legionella pneumophila]HBB7076563.1 hypothetical protein [Legionella pneumophila]HBD7142070.1 hypothetical protein [Legionella pneumophila]